MDDKIKQIDEEILAFGRTKSLRAGDVLIQKNDPANFLYYVKNGSCLILNDSTHSVVGKESYIDPLPVFCGKQYPFMVIAKENSEIVCVDPKETSSSNKLLFLYIQRKSMISELKTLGFE